MYRNGCSIGYGNPGSGGGIGGTGRNPAFGAAAPFSDGEICDESDAT